jgi:hypothetical protein
VTKIWKFPLQLTDRQEIEMPEGAVILSVQVQRSQVCLWALVEPGASKVKRQFRIHGTGHDVPDVDKLDFIGTIQNNGGDLVFHVFEEFPTSDLSQKPTWPGDK